MRENWNSPSAPAPPRAHLDMSTCCRLPQVRDIRAETQEVVVTRLTSFFKHTRYTVPVDQCAPAQPRALTSDSHRASSALPSSPCGCTLRAGDAPSRSRQTQPSGDTVVGRSRRPARPSAGARRALAGASLPSADCPPGVASLAQRPKCGFPLRASRLQACVPRRLVQRRWRHRLPSAPLPPPDGVAAPLAAGMQRHAPTPRLGRPSEEGRCAPK